MANQAPLRCKVQWSPRADRQVPTADCLTRLAVDLLAYTPVPGSPSSSWKP